MWTIIFGRWGIEIETEINGSAEFIDGCFGLFRKRLVALAWSTSWHEGHGSLGRADEMCIWKPIHQMPTWMHRRDDSMPMKRHFHLAPQQQHLQLDRMHNNVSYFGKKNAIHAVLMNFLLLIAHHADFKSSSAFNIKHKRTCEILGNVITGSQQGYTKIARWCKGEQACGINTQDLVLLRVLWTGCIGE